MPKIEQTFRVAQPVAVVWDFFQDVPAVAECMPGVELEDHRGGNVYAGSMSMKLGPISARFQGEAEITDLDPTAHSGSIVAKGVDRKGGSRARATVRYEATDVDSQTEVSISANISLQGALAQFGRSGLIEEISGQLTQEFVSCLERKLGASSKEEAGLVKSADVKGLRLMLRAFWHRLKSLLGNTTAKEDDASNE